MSCCDNPVIYTPGFGSSVAVGDGGAPSGPAGGDLTGSYPNPTIGAAKVTTSKVADNAITNAKIVSLEYAKLLNVPTSLPPDGAAGGDLGGTYPNPTVGKIQGRAVGAGAPALRHVWVWDGAAWTSRLLAVQDISDFAEGVDDRVAALLQEGANISLIYDDVAGSMTVAIVDGPGSGLDADTVDGVELAGLVQQTEKGAANGVATLGADTKIPMAQLPAGIAGGLSYQGTWNATTNTPAIAAGVGTNGHYYKVATAGTSLIDGENSWAVGDWIIFNGANWQKIDNSEPVSSVNGQAGAVVLSAGDVGALSTANNLSDLADVPTAQNNILTAGCITTTRINDAAVTRAKMANVASGIMLGRVSIGAGAIEDLTALQVRSNLGWNGYMNPAASNSLVGPAFLINVDLAQPEQIAYIALSDPASTIGWDPTYLQSGLRGTVVVQQDGTGGYTPTLVAPGGRVIKVRDGALTWDTDANAYNVMSWFIHGSIIFVTAGAFS